MDIDQKQTGTPLPAGWAFGRNSIKPHWFDAGHTTSICGKGSNSNLQRNNRVPHPSDCAACKSKLEKRAKGVDE